MSYKGPLICQVWKLPKCTFHQHLSAMDEDPLGKALMGTSPKHIWASTPNNRELVSAKHHNKLVFLIKILFLP